MIVESPQQEILGLPREGLESWNNQDPYMKDFCEETLFRVKSKIVKRQLYLEPCFKDLDKYSLILYYFRKCFKIVFLKRLNTGHVTNTQMRRVLSQNGILISDEEFYALIRRYSNDIGFNYSWFLKEADPQEYLIFAPKVCSIHF